MSLSIRAKKSQKRAFTDNKSANELIDIIEELMSVLFAITTKMDSDTGIADVDYSDEVAQLQAIIDANSGN